jgi:diketogulonate reductase-like aldo/keto reductase
MVRAMSALTTTNVPLRTGSAIPQVGLGVWQASPEECRAAVGAALRLGYRHIDTARIYGNEADVGAAIRDSGIPREHVFITTKLWNDDQGYDTALRAFDASAKRLGVEYIDLYLIHWPVPGKRLDSWRALEKLRADKRARAIGVSNFLVPQLEELFAAANEKPAVNQIELTPFLQRRETQALCKREKIVVEAYSPLTRGKRLGHPVIAAIADELGRSPAQVLLRWNIEHGNVVLPKSVRPERIAENGALFDFQLSPEQLARLDALEENLATGWDPATMA